jgi:hypothetical protein
MPPGTKTLCNRSGSAERLKYARKNAELIMIKTRAMPVQQQLDEKRLKCIGCDAEFFDFLLSANFAFTKL